MPVATNVHENGIEELPYLFGSEEYQDENSYHEVPVSRLNINLALKNSHMVRLLKEEQKEGMRTILNNQLMSERTASLSRSSSGRFWVAITLLSPSSAAVLYA